MSNNCNTIAEILLRGGTDQLRRTSKKLNPESIVLHGFGLQEWMEFAYNFASHVKYFEAENGTQNGFWVEFFKDDVATEALLADLESSDELTPHLTLFICFLRLLEFSSDRMNNITKRHLDFYYQEVLQIEKLPPTYDKVHVLFELSKNATQTKLEAGTKLNGGKDANDVPRFYELIDETVVNGAQLSDFKSFYFDPDYTNPTTGNTTAQYYMKAAEVANSLDGLGEELGEDQTTWYGFGYNHNRVDDPFEELPNANIGFAVTSHALSLSEGIRNVQFEIKFDSIAPSLTVNQLLNVIEVSYTTAEGWSEPIALKSSFSFTGANNAAGTYSTSIVSNSNLVKLLVELDNGDEPTANYNESIHGLSMDTENPVFRFKLNTNSVAGLSVYKQFIRTVNYIDIKLHVSGVRKLTLDNDTGTLNPEKPMYPFTPLPVKGSSFSIYHDEVFSKQWDFVSVDIDWKNTPDNFFSWYQQYKAIFNSFVTLNAYVLTAKVTKGTQAAVNAAAELQLPVSIIDEIVGSNSYFKATRAVKVDGVWDDAESTTPVTLFQGSNPFSTTVNYVGSHYDYGTTESLRISLNQSFLHEMYPKLYAVALTSGSDETPLPNQPYTPLTEEVSLTYIAHDHIELNDSTEANFTNRENGLYHQDAFGVALQHPYLRSQLDFLSNTKCTLVPKHCRGGELYVGIEGADNLQNVAMLIQVLEGSENKRTPTFLGNQGVSWEILCDNHWKKLDSTLLLKNSTDNFLQTGIVKFKIPKEATDDNTLLPSGKFWVRASMLKSFDAVCKIVNIHAQVATAIFTDNGNELSHLETGLAAETITKLFQRAASIKGVEQPYNSFGGKPEESDSQYYQRVSERLRHKNRAINLWDYEHLVLQEFPDLFRVKCLNHTSPTSFTAPGHVTLIVIPDTVNKNVFNPFQPRVSTAYLNKVDDYISKLNTMHANVHVENPTYEELTVSLKVKFNEGLDETIYKLQLNDDIIRFLSPWAFDETKQVDFGRTLHISVLINYIEKLDYVDYLQDVTMSVNGGTGVKNYTPTTPKAIMVSAKNHTISTDIITCEPTTEIITEECQQ